MLISSWKRVIVPSLALFLLAGATSCGESSASTSVKYASDFRPGATTVSMFGTFRDGRLDQEFGALVGPALASSFGRHRCETAYGAELAHRNADLYNALDEQAKSDGITDELLGKVAPMAEGALILVVSVHGAAAPRSFGGAEVDPGAMGPQASARGAPRNRIPAGALRRYGAKGGLVMTASFYSVRLGRGVARMTMNYEGPSVEDAVRRFGEELAKVVPGSTCRGFRWP